MFPACDTKHPVCFVLDGQVTVSSECTGVVICEGIPFDCILIDYYADYIIKELKEYADKLNAYWEWNNPATISLCRN